MAFPPYRGIGTIASGRLFLLVSCNLQATNHCEYEYEYEYAYDLQAELAFLVSRFSYLVVVVALVFVSRLSAAAVPATLVALHNPSPALQVSSLILSVGLLVGRSVCLPPPLPLALALLLPIYPLA